ncbi:Serine/threonine-protein kinase pkn1 [termite gut metagenome]|uniref:Serine/threonine-protein kinase pkn1 n=1 Tax=termite gut metagenome TaxID=433724 RepID=A0A5J4SXT5_9ZZZZ
MKRNMILIRILGGWLIGAILLIGCSSEDDGQGISGDNLVRFNSQLANISSVSRSSDILSPIVLTKENWMLGDTIGVYMKYSDVQSFSEANVKNHGYLSTKNNVSTSIFVPASKEDEIYFSDGGVDFMSYYPYKSTIGEKDIYPIDISGQGDNPSKVDLLYATSDGKLSEKRDVSLSFKHQLSKLVLNLKPDLAIQELRDVWPSLIVRASGFYTKADFSLIDKVISNRHEIEDFSGAKTSDGMKVELIMIPQTVGRNMYLKFGLLGKDNELQWNIPEGAVFEAGKQYEYTVSIKMTWVDVFEGEIRLWEGDSKIDDIVWGKSSDTQYGLTKIAGGEYYIGSPEGEGEENEHPRHKVDVGGGWISSYEITNKQYAIFLNEKEVGSSGKNGKGEQLIDIGVSDIKMKYINDKWIVDNPTDDPFKWDNYPVVNVSWYEARAFAQWLGGDLPTEAEWETACRAKSDALFWFGNKSETFNYFLNCKPTSKLIPVNKGVSGVIPVNFLEKNAFKLYNTHGNVYEWCLDAVGRDAMGSAAPYDSKIKVSEKIYHPIRGGSWKVDLEKCRSASRDSYLPEQRADDIGFRVVFPVSNVPILDFKYLEEFLAVSP